LLFNEITAFSITVNKTLQQNKAPDKWTNSPGVVHIIYLIKDNAFGYKLSGAVGGGCIYMVAEDPEATL